MDETSAGPLLHMGNKNMRIRATVVAVSGALALSALAFPASAQADETPVARLAASPFGAKAKISRAVADTKITSVVVNGGKDITLGTTVPKTITATVTATDDSGIQDAIVYLWHGADIDHVDGYLGPDVSDDTAQIAKCTKVNATTSTCKITFKVDPHYDLYKNDLAGTWKVAAAALAKDYDSVDNDKFRTMHVQRVSTLNVNAAPEPVKKGKTITVTGKLARANWETYKYQGYTGQPVKLQFRKKNSNTYTTVKTIKTNSTGNLKTTVKAVEDGYWRYNFAGTTTTPAVVATGDFVDVK